MKGFKDFIMRGNLLELAVAFIMGAAFSAVITSFTNVVLSVISKIIGGNPNFDSVTWGGVPVGPFFTALFSFLLVAVVVYFAIVLPVNTYKARHEQATHDESEVDLLTDIRELLKEQATPKE